MAGDDAMILWEHFRHYFELAALEHPACCDLDELRELVREGKLMSIGVFTGSQMIAAAAVEIYDTRQGKALHVRYLAGSDMEMWLDEMQARLFEIARAYGCRWVSLTGRQGWRKALQKLNWNPIAIQMRCEVPYG